MSRQTIALMIALYAIAFAFASMAAIRWPSVMMVLAFMIEGEGMKGVPDLNWRELGILYGAPYFLAALCLYASAMMLSQRRAGSVVWYAMGCVAGFPCAFLIEFESGWWRNPGIWESVAIGGALGAVLLGMAVWLLRDKRVNQELEVNSTSPSADLSDVTEVPKVIEVEADAAAPRTQRRRRVSPAIAQQRARWAREGRAMLARERKRSKLL
ncbi:MAG: hypothetical protein AAF296_04880 [Pseudomonadota bacterium]